MKEYRNLAWPFYLTGLVIIVVPAVEFVLTVSPLSPSILSWRYGAVGLLSRSIMTPMVGVVVIFGTAVLLEHTWVQRGVMVLGFVGCAVLLLAIAMFALDLLQFRNQVRAEARTAYNAASAVALMKLLAGTVVLLAFGVGGLRTARHAAARRRRSAPAPLIARPGQGEETTPDP
jgi:hypothetical protein